MTTRTSVRWSLGRAAFIGCVISAVLVAMHFARGVEPYPSQTLAGQIGYWLGYAGIYPIIFVIIAAIRNAFIPKDPNAERRPSVIGNFFWPATFKAQPSGVARFGRVLHWLFAMGAAAFVIGGVYTLFATYDTNTGLALIAFGGGICFLIGRALRYILAGE